MAEANSLLSNIERVPLSDVAEHPQNPRKGNVELIAESLQHNKQYRPIIVQRSTGHIIAGNHTYRAAKHLGWDSIDATYIDVDDEHALRIMVADNRTSDQGTYDANILAEVLRALPDPSVGTGYSEDDLSILIGTTEADIEAVNEVISGGEGPLDVSMFNGQGGDAEDAKYLDPRVEEARERGRGTNYEADPEEINELDDIAEMQSVLALTEEVEFPSSNRWSVPDLKPSMLLEELPEKFDTWGGKDATPDDGETHWLYNYGVASMSGLPLERAILCFFTHDHYFENWWNSVAYYTTRMLVGGITRAVVPDFSFYYSEPRVVHLYNVYRAQWIGRYLQEAGIKVIPRIQFDYTDKEPLEFAMLGTPVDVPILAYSGQNFEKDENNITRSAAILSEALQELKPKTVLLYGGNPVKRMWEQVTGYNGECVHLYNYAAKRRGVVYDKKEGLAGVNAKVRRALLHKAQKDKTGDDIPVEDE